MGDPSLLGPAKAKILTLLLSQARTAGQTAESLKIQVSAARKHLERLIELGLVSERFQKGSMGRPKKLYELTEKGKELFPRQYDMILNMTLDRLAREKTPDYPETIMRRVAEDLAHREAPGQRRLGEAAEQLVKLLDGLGFKPGLNEDRDEYVFTSANCPLLKTAVAHGEIVCRGFHEEFMKRYLGAKQVKRETWIVDGDAFCTHTVPKP